MARAVSVDVTLTADADTEVWCHVYPSRAPILVVSTPAVYLTVAPANCSGVGDGDLHVARKLLAAFTTYVAALEAEGERTATTTWTPPIDVTGSARPLAEVHR